ncbi:MAG: acetate/propionate family kinase [Bacteroidia bacterium]|nr:acetate/propionate family kinase [Bacteroidia bacterium]
MLKEGNILTINGGSSSIKFSLYKTGEPLILLLSGEIENIGTKNAKLHYTNSKNKPRSTVNIKSKKSDEITDFLINWLKKQEGFDSVLAIGHRIVHGMQHTEPEIITPQLIKELKEISDFDPEHLPQEIKLIEIFKKHFPTLKQISCFDTSFHTSMPTVAKLLTIPRSYYEKGIQRYGFHGISYAYLLQELKRIEGDKTANGKLILAHLGNGASLAAVENGKSKDTSMGFTPISGIPMSTRTGDLDPGVVSYLMKHEKISPKQFNTLINHQSGLLGLSETSSDMRELLKSEETDVRAKEAIDLFCYQVKKYIGAYSTVLEGLDGLVFSGGIGENSPEIRSGICKNLLFLGIEIDESKNNKNEFIISSDTSKVKVYVIKTNEELMIAKLVYKTLL